MIKILLINPCLRSESPLKILPVGLACIATALNNAGYRPDILDIDLHRLTDEQVNTFLATHSYDIVGFGNIISSYKITKKLCTQVKQAMPDTLLMIGNTVATSIPELLLTCIPEVDIAVIGEGDITVREISTAVANKEPWQAVSGIAYRHNGTVVRTQDRKPVTNVEDIPFPDYTLFDVREYLDASPLVQREPLPLPREQMKSIPVNTARGCPYNCTFCNHAFKKYKYRTYPFRMVVEFFKSYQSSYDAVNYLNFWDELTLISRKKTLELCDAIEESGLKAFWHIGSRGNLFNRDDLDLLKRCKSLGALTIGGALESGDTEILIAMNKSQRPGGICRAVHRTDEYRRKSWIISHDFPCFRVPPGDKREYPQNI